MSQEFFRLFVTVTLMNEKLLHWQMNGSFKPAGSVDFYVDKARSGGDWQEIGGPITDDCFYMDPVKWNWNTDKNAFYRVRFKTGADWQYSTPVQALGTWTKRDYALAREICRKETVLHREVGMPGVLLKRKEWGPPCPDCLDFDTREVADGQCPTCLGVGIVGGYYTPIPVTMINPSPEVSERNITDKGVEQPTAKQVRCIAYPFIEPKDLWFNSNNGQRWNIRKVDIIAERKSIPILYMLTIKEVPQTDVIYSDKANDLAESEPEEKPEGNGTEYTWDDGLNCEDEF